MSFAIIKPECFNTVLERAIEKCLYELDRNSLNPLYDKSDDAALTRLRSLTIFHSEYILIDSTDAELLQKYLSFA
jgi:hypothetical protein